MLSLVTGLSERRSRTKTELLHLSLQPQAEGGPHFTRFGTVFRPYKHEKCGPAAQGRDRRTGGPFRGRYGADDRRVANWHNSSSVIFFEANLCISATEGL